MDALHHEGEDAGLVLGVAQDAQAGQGAEALGGVDQQLVLPGGDALQAQTRDVVDGGSKTDGRGDGGCAGFELAGRGHVGGLLPGDGADHVAAAVPGGHGLQVGQLAVEHADARGARQLVAAEDVEVGVEVLHVHLQVRHRLGAVHQHGDALGVGPGDDLFHGIDGAQHVAHMDQPHQLGTLGEQVIQGLQNQLPGIVHGDDLDRGALLLGQHLPGHDVGVVLHGREQDLVAGLDPHSPIGLGHQVDGLGGAAGPDDLADGCSAQEAADLLPGGLEVIRRLLAEGADAAVDVGVLLPLVLGHALDDREGHLPAHGAVEVDHGLAVEDAGEQGKVLADGGDVEGLGAGAHARSPREPAWVRAMTRRRRARRRLATGMRCSTSAAKP